MNQRKASARIHPAVPHYPPGSVWSRWYGGADAAAITATTESALRAAALRAARANPSKDCAEWSDIQAKKLGRGWRYRFGLEWGNVNGAAPQANRESEGESTNANE